MKEWLETARLVMTEKEFSRLDMVLIGVLYCIGHAIYVAFR